MTPTTLSAAAMLFDVGTKLAPLEWIGTAVAVAVAIGMGTAMVHEMVRERFEPLFRLDLADRVRKDRASAAPRDLEEAA